VSQSEITQKIQAYMEKLTEEITNRHPGTIGNYAATDFFAQTIASFGFETQKQQFDCIDWEWGEVILTVGDEAFQAYVGSYSLPFDGLGQLVSAGTIAELENADITGKILLLHSELAKEQIMPKNYPFYNPVEHQQLVSLLERGNPLAIIAATTRNPQLAGGKYPYSLFEDGNFNIPSVFMTAEEGARLKRHQGATVNLQFESQRIASFGCNVIARKGRNRPGRIVFCAHIDTKKETPGALDNAAGVATLLALAEILANYNGELGLEIVAFNGEDYYAASGEVRYLEQNSQILNQILLAVNLDALGYIKGKTAFSLYGCDTKLANIVQDSLKPEYQFTKGEPWPQSDHMVFAINQVPAVAVTSEYLMEITTNITHTAKDELKMVDCSKLCDAAFALSELFNNLVRANQ